MLLVQLMSKNMLFTCLSLRTVGFCQFILFKIGAVYKHMVKCSVCRTLTCQCNNKKKEYEEDSFPKLQQNMQNLFFMKKINLIVLNSISLRYQFIMILNMGKIHHIPRQVITLTVNC